MEWGCPQCKSCYQEDMRWCGRCDPPVQCKAIQSQITKADLRSLLVDIESKFKKEIADLKASLSMHNGKLPRAYHVVVVQ